MLIDQIAADMKEAMRARDTARLATLRMLKSAIEYQAIASQQETLPDSEVLVVIKKQVKQRQDSIAGFTQGGRNDLVEKEKAELEILQGYLPEQLSEAAITEIVRAVIAEVGAAGKADMGKVMKALQPRLAGRADNRLVSQIVSAQLA